MTSHVFASNFRGGSRHADYQLPPQGLDGELSARGTHHEEARLAYLLSQCDPTGKTVLDIGANAGFFTLSLADAGASHVLAIEGDPQHAAFIAEGAGRLGLSGRVSVRPEYFEFDGVDDPVDLTLLLNVVHHRGADYGVGDGMDHFRRNMLRDINSLAVDSKYMLLQVGFNAHGRVDLPIFAAGTKQEMIDFVAAGVEDHWRLVDVAIAEVDHGDPVTYRTQTAELLRRRDDLGEFLNRPLFYLESRHPWS